MLRLISSTVETVRTWQMKKCTVQVLPFFCVAAWNLQIFWTCLQILSGSVRLDVWIGLKVLALVEDIHRGVPLTLRWCPGWVFRGIRCEPPPGSQSLLWPRLVSRILWFINTKIENESLMHPRWGHRRPGLLSRSKTFYWNERSVYLHPSHSTTYSKAWALQLCSFAALHNRVTVRELCQLSGLHDSHPFESLMDQQRSTESLQEFLYSWKSRIKINSKVMTQIQSASWHRGFQRLIFIQR